MQAGSMALDPLLIALLGDPITRGLGHLSPTLGTSLSLMWISFEIFPFIKLVL